MNPIDRGEFAAGVRWWQTKTRWRNDFHNSAYVVLSAQNPNGDFRDDWWPDFLRRLTQWGALRPLSGVEVTRRLAANRDELASAWRQACAPVKDLDITGVAWEQVRAFPEVVARLKPTKYGSPVFPSKFCHFLLPRIFPVFDNAAVGGSHTYETYFGLIKGTWEATPAGLQDELVAELARLVDDDGQGRLYAGFPAATKITELALIGRRHA
ncbi:hypothetical protein [Micromonospora sp. KC723]|uniref:hypothetical protein n=1 Tax=Micromonospora sp. KC723 TaxID=2530381 RepID=UPI0010442B16|nr:hypothetical protein [Micromonospora sp. KC723]TDB74338.1 hypothetical protein E1165_14790 [Micromonospora sp. KC723]